MSLQLELSPELEQDLATEAARAGLPLPEYAVRVLAASQNGKTRPRNGAELVAFWQEAGVIGSRPEIDDPVAHAQTLRDAAQRRVL